MSGFPSASTEEPCQDPFPRRSQWITINGLNTLALHASHSAAYRLFCGAVRVALTLPLVGRVAAGSPILAQEHIEASYALDPDLFDSPPDYLLKVRGLSMRDAGILDGDLLAVRRSPDARNGQIVVVRLGEEVTVKRWQRTGHRIDLLPENPDFQPIVIDGRHDPFTIEGIGVGLIRAGRSL